MCEAMLSALSRGVCWSRCEERIFGQWIERLQLVRQTQLCFSQRAGPAPLQAVLLLHSHLLQQSPEKLLRRGSGPPQLDLSGLGDPHSGDQPSGPRPPSPGRRRWRLSRHFTSGPGRQQWHAQVLHFPPQRLRLRPTLQPHRQADGRVGAERRGRSPEPQRRHLGVQRVEHEHRAVRLQRGHPGLHRHFGLQRHRDLGNGSQRLGPLLGRGAVAAAGRIPENRAGASGRGRRAAGRRKAQETGSSFKFVQQASKRSPVTTTNFTGK